MISEPTNHTYSVAWGDVDGDGDLDVRFALRGWSQPRRSNDTNVIDHRIEITLNGTSIGNSEWNGKRYGNDERNFIRIE